MLNIISIEKRKQKTITKRAKQVKVHTQQLF